MAEKGRITCRQLEITDRVRITIGFKDYGVQGMSVFTPINC